VVEGRRCHSHVIRHYKTQTRADTDTDTRRYRHRHQRRWWGRRCVVATMCWSPSFINHSHQPLPTNHSHQPHLLLHHRCFPSLPPCHTSPTPSKRVSPHVASHCVTPHVASHYLVCVRAGDARARTRFLASGASPHSACTHTHIQLYVGSVYVWETEVTCVYARLHVCMRNYMHLVVGKPPILDLGVVA